MMTSCGNGPKNLPETFRGAASTSQDALPGLPVSPGPLTSPTVAAAGFDLTSTLSETLNDVMEGVTWVGSLVSIGWPMEWSALEEVTCPSSSEEDLAFPDLRKLDRGNIRYQVTVVTSPGAPGAPVAPDASFPRWPKGRHKSGTTIGAVSARVPVPVPVPAPVPVIECLVLEVPVGLLSEMILELSSLLSELALGS